MDDHFAVAKATLELSQKLQIQPEVSEVNARLADRARQMLHELGTSGGLEFERAYIKRQAEHLQAALVAHEALGAATRGSVELEALLARARDTLEADLERARAIERSLG